MKSPLHTYQKDLLFVCPVKDHPNRAFQSAKRPTKCISLSLSSLSSHGVSWMKKVDLFQVPQHYPKKCLKMQEDPLSFFESIPCCDRFRAELRWDEEASRFVLYMEIKRASWNSHKRICLNCTCRWADKQMTMPSSQKRNQTTGNGLMYIADTVPVPDQTLLNIRRDGEEGQSSPADR